MNDVTQAKVIHGGNRSKCDGLGSHHLVRPRTAVTDCASKRGPDNVSQPLRQGGLVRDLSNPVDLGWA